MRGSGRRGGRSSAQRRFFVGLRVQQPRKLDDRAFVSQGDFDRALYMQRERELRGDV